MNLYEKMEQGVYVIAEMSANHGGKLSNALKIVEEAAEAGADCVKIQTYTADTLTINCTSEPYIIRGGLWDGYNYYQLYQEASTPWEWQQTIQEKCREVGVDFLSTPFDNTAVDFLEGLGVEFYKIASFELVDIPLIEYVASKGKPIVMSVGMGSVQEITEALEACKRQGNEQVVLLKCCSQYPAQYEDMNLSVIRDMKERFRVPVGLSDHSFGSLAPVVAVSMGAKVIEKHVCLNRDMETPDSGFSMEMSEFAKMVEDVRNASVIMGKPTYELTENERNGLGGRRSLVAVKPICKGEAFTRENVRSIRPGIGILPKYYPKLLTKTAKKDYAFGEPIAMSEIEL
ncbi:MAG: pseudaminic acid synthase [Clostridiales bacterium]|nr:pseudaminic acid synthase [Clostridiales bacterium]